MAEDQPIAFGPKAVEQIAQTVREVARRMQNETPHRGRWQQRPGGGVITIRFQITDPVYCEACTATGTVLSRPPGMATVPGEYDGTVTIADRLGCFLNESNEALIGRKGYAVYLSSEFEGPCPGMPNPSFEIISLCCAETQCAS
jgi:hypothetical protein